MRQRSTLLFLSVVALAACSDDNDHLAAGADAGKQLDSSVATTSDASTDAGNTQMSDAAAPPTDCFQNPTTHLEILNACTDAEKVVKNPSLPLLMVDGGLPPLP